MNRSLNTILIADDELSLREFVSENLLLRGFDVISAENGQETVELFEEKQPDLIILDIMMPVMDGYDACKLIRRQSTVPIIMLSALDEDESIIRALDLGADDYLTKPFSVDELMARVRAAVRRANWVPDGAANTLKYGDLEVDPVRSAVLLHGELIELTRTEYAILHHLMQSLGKTVSHHTLLEAIWGGDHGHEPAYLRVYIGRIRRKIERDPAQPDYIISEYGKGYRIGGGPIAGDEPSE